MLVVFGNVFMFWFVFVLWFYFIGDIEVILVLCFIIGVFIGSIYVNLFCVVGE